MLLGGKMFKEEWKPIEGFEGRYEVSNKGRVWSNLRGKELSQWKINSGYMSVRLFIDGKQKSKTVHRLVAKAFCSGYQEGLEVNHKDTDRTNNNFDNLEWVTRLENIRDIVERGTLDTHTAREKLATVSKKQVDMFTKDGEEYIRTYNSIKEACKDTGAQQAHISRVCHGKRQSAGGYHWKFNDSVDKNRSVSTKWKK